VTASEILFFWVARMIMAGFEFMGDLPFREVYIHGTVRDDSGRKMSKSLGNSIDPLAVIEQYSADALRFSLVMITATGQDVFVSNEKFEIGRNFGTKLWNAARYMQMHAPDFPLSAATPELDPAQLSSDDRHILAGLHRAIAACTDGLERFRFNDVAHELYEFIWHQYCDWYVEYSKDILYGQDRQRRTQVLKVMHYVFSTSLRLLHPLMPFITEELWHGLGYGGADESIMRTAWPQALPEEALERWGATADVVTYVDDKHDLIRVGRTLRADYEIAPAVKIDYIIKPADRAAGERLAADRAAIAGLLRAANLRVELDFAPAQAMPSAIGKLGTIYLPVKGLIDVPAERARLEAQRTKILAEIKRITGKLENRNFIGKAPEEVVAEQRRRRQELVESGNKLAHLIEMLEG
jgi:valyl-tRNA synthetase